MARRRTMRGGESRYTPTTNVGIVHCTPASFVPDALKATALAIHADGQARRKSKARSMVREHRHDMAARQQY